MEFEFSEKVQGLRARVQAFMDAHITPNEAIFAAQLAAAADRWQAVPIVEELKKVAKSEGLWNLFLAHSKRGFGLSNLEYAPLSEIMGRVQWASEVFNCSAPDTGNMETLELYGTEAQKDRWLEAVAAGRHPLGLLHDRACRRLVGRHQHRNVGSSARGRRLRHQRPQMVVLRRWGPALRRCSSSWASPTRRTWTSTASNP